MSDVVRFGVSLEQELLEEFDTLSKKRGYANRSDAIRHCIRKEINEEAIKDPKAKVAGVLTLVYDHHESDLPRRLTDMQHQAHDAVLATLHVHLDTDRCLEVLTIRGTCDEVQSLADKLSSAKGVLQGSLTLAPLAPSASPAPLTPITQKIHSH